MIVNGINNFSNIYINNQSKVNKPYYEDGKASLEYLKLAQEKLENDPIYNPLNDKNLGKSEILNLALFGALDPDIVEQRKIEWENTPKIDTEELVKTLNKFFKNLDKLTSDSISNEEKNKLMKSIFSNTNEDIQISQSKEEIKQEENKEKTEDKKEKPFKAIEAKSTNVRESMQDILNKLDIRNIKDERDLLALILTYKNSENLYDKRV
ncbi:hypothetical protein AVCANL279_09005 [Campylobacter canadensis]|uniref:Uncharacterized protein n=2 Tax=Campylobacter canadensis TaxID=449520 RepID=A0ABS7WTU0_9BACT|nr:hypothetical protein [Campylobacter canadensis]MBZ7988187.1 hypothetical protein [Campylobacter canadensis]MBZ7995643.1 hypothetical protein [Campylobacter canadensis]MBZ7997444.1 hypothetical protein [Campylobacter canadensis]MBZ8000982.1 hypothetical protein [Campylobacter canadensis]MBZ8002815.1 hypothetical protein [Campylobacter canadensis]